MEAKKSADEFKLGMKEDRMMSYDGPGKFDIGKKDANLLTGKAAMERGPMEIHENSVESEIIIDCEEGCTKLDTMEKRLKINAGAMESVFTSMDQDQLIDRGLQDETEA